VIYTHSITDVLVWMQRGTDALPGMSLLSGLLETVSITRKLKRIPFMQNLRESSLWSLVTIYGSLKRQMLCKLIDFGLDKQVSGSGQSYSRTEDINNAFANEVSWDRSSASSTQATTTQRPSERTYGAI